MNSTELQDYPWDVSIEAKDDVILIDLGDNVVYLTKSDLTDMLEAIQ